MFQRLCYNFAGGSKMFTIPEFIASSAKGNSLGQADFNHCGPPEGEVFTKSTSSIARMYCFARKGLIATLFTYLWCFVSSIH